MIWSPCASVKSCCLPISVIHMRFEQWGLNYKNKCKFWEIHHLFFLRGTPVKHIITKKAWHFCWTRLDNVFQKLVFVRSHFDNIKCEIKNKFYNIPLALNIEWLLEFCWRVCFYTKYCRLFRLWISLFIFNGFGDVFHEVF